MNKLIKRLISCTLALVMMLTIVPNIVENSACINLKSSAVEGEELFSINISGEKADYEIEVVDSDKNVIKKNDDGKYSLYVGVNYIYTAHKGNNSVSGTLNVSDVNDVQDIVLSISEEENWLSNISFGPTMNNKDEYSLSSDFNSEKHNYELIVPEVNYNLYVWAELNGNSHLPDNTKIQACFINAVNNNSATANIVSGNEKGIKLNNLLAKGRVSQPFSIIACYEKNGLTYKQSYNFNIKTDTTTLAELNVSADDEMIDIFPVFSNDETDYEIYFDENVKQIGIIATSTQSYYTIEVNGQQVLSEEKILIDVDSVVDNIIQIKVKNDSYGTENTYSLKLNKTSYIDTQLNITPAGSSVVVLTSKNERIFPDSQGKYKLLKGIEYKYVVTKPGYISKADSFNALSGVISISLDKAEENLAIKADIPSAWPTFRGDNTNNCVVDVATPKTADETLLYWATKKGNGWDSGAIGSPIIVDDYLVFCSGKKLYKMNRFNGEMLEQAGDMAAASSFNVVPPLYADGMIFVGLSGGIIQAFNADTLESLWVYTDPLGGQPNCPLMYNNGYVYTGFWNAESGKFANFVCVSATDENINKTDEEKIASWTYTVEGGFYWAGAYVCDSFVLVGTDDGKSGYLEDTSKLLSLNPVTGELIDKIENLNGDIRSSVTYDKVTDRYYFTSKGGSFYSVAVNEDGTFKKNDDGIQGYDLKEILLYNYANDKINPAMSTSTPVVYNGRAYIGVSGTAQFSMYSGHNITVIDLKEWKIAYTVPTKGYPQTSGLLTTKYEDKDGFIYVYFIDNYTPGQLRVLKDKPGVTSVVDGVKETYMYRGKLVEVIGCPPVLFTPEDKHAQYAICSPICDEYGTLYFKNDSAFMMAVGSKIKSIEVTKQPDKTVYGVSEKFDPAGMRVVAHLSNGLDRDITEYVNISNEEELTIDDTDIAVSYNIVMYGDKLDANNGNQTGIYAEPLETYVDIAVLDSEKVLKIRSVEDKINLIGEVTLESEELIVNAREEYNSLDEDLQKYVSNANSLIESENKLAGLKAQADSSSVEESSESEASSQVDSSSAEESSESEASSQVDSSSVDESSESSSEIDSSSTNESSESSSEIDSTSSSNAVSKSNGDADGSKSKSTVNTSTANTGNNDIGFIGIAVILALGFIACFEIKNKGKD